MIVWIRLTLALIFPPHHWRAGVTPVNNTLESSLKGFTRQHCAGNAGWKQLGKLMGCLNEWEVQVNASVPDFHMNAAEFPFRVGSDSRIIVGAASQKGFERVMMKQAWSEGLSGCNIGSLKDFSHGFPFAVLLLVTKSFHMLKYKLAPPVIHRT